MRDRGVPDGVQREAEAEAGAEPKGRAGDRLLAERVLGPGQDGEPERGDCDPNPGDRVQAIVKNNQSKDGRQRQRALLERGADRESGATHRHEQRGGGHHLPQRPGRRAEPELGREVGAGGRREGGGGRHERQRKRQAEQKAHQRRPPRPRRRQYRPLQPVARDLEEGREHGGWDPDEGEHQVCFTPFGAPRAPNRSQREREGPTAEGQWEGEGLRPLRLASDAEARCSAAGVCLQRCNPSPSRSLRSGPLPLPLGEVCQLARASGGLPFSLRLWRLFRALT